MSAGPHLLRRLRRWWHIRLLQTRATQQAALVAQMEQDLDQYQAELASMHGALRDTYAQLAAAQYLHAPERRPFTWGM